MLLLLWGVPSGNIPLVLLATIPIAFFFLTSLGGGPRRVDATTTLPPHTVKVGDIVPVEVRYEIHGGPGLVELHQALPGVFLLESGNNLHLATKGVATLRGSFRFTMRATRRGHFEIPPLEWEAVPALGFAQSRRGNAGAAHGFDVRPRVTPMRRMMRARAQATRFFPESDVARVGVQTTEFRDIREYVRGDPPRTINWKATARQQSRLLAAAGRHPRGPRHEIRPLVNEYEHEGKKTVWVFLDGGPYMRVGTSAFNAFEAAVSAATGTAHYFIERGYRVGFTLYNQDTPQHLYPDTGHRQVFRIQELAAQAEPSRNRGGLPIAVEGAKRFLAMGRSLIVVVTRGDIADETTLAGLRRLRRLGGTRRHRSPVIVASVDPFGLLPEAHAGTHAARLIQRHRHAARLRAIRRTGATLLHWDPAATRFEQLLLSRRPGR